MKKIPFNLEYWIGHHPMLETKEGRRARIICIDAKGMYPIIALISYCKDLERPVEYRDTGNCNPQPGCLNDLFMLIH